MVRDILRRAGQLPIGWSQQASSRGATRLERRGHDAFLAVGPRSLEAVPASVAPAPLSNATTRSPRSTRADGRHAAHLLPGLRASKLGDRDPRSASSSKAVQWIRDYAARRKDTFIVAVVARARGTCVWNRGCGPKARPGYDLRASSTGLAVRRGRDHARLGYSPQSQEDGDPRAPANIKGAAQKMDVSSTPRSGRLLARNLEHEALGQRCVSAA